MACQTSESWMSRLRGRYWCGKKWVSYSFILSLTNAGGRSGFPVLPTLANADRLADHVHTKMEHPSP